MDIKLQVSFISDDLDHVLSCAEECIAGGADLLEASNYLLKNVGLSCISSLREKFSDIPIVADIKTTAPIDAEIREIAEKGASAFTVSGAISQKNWQLCYKNAQKHGLKIFLDFRNLPYFIIQSQSSLAREADCTIIDYRNNIADIMREIALSCQARLAIDGLTDNDDIESLLPLGMIIAGIHCKEHEQAQEHTETIKQILEEKEAPPWGNAYNYSKQMLCEIFKQITPSSVCQVVGARSILLENLFPIHRFTKIFGQAMTIKTEATPGVVSEIILGAPENSIIVIDAENSKQAVWDSSTTAIALKRNIAGAVINGAITDVAYMHAKGFSCYTSSLTPLHANVSSFARPIVDMPIQIGAVTIGPGDWLLGDDSGIICIPGKKIFQIADNALRLTRAREKLLYQLEKSEDSTAIKDLLEQYQKVGKKT